MQQEILQMHDSSLDHQPKSQEVIAVCLLQGDD